MTPNLTAFLMAIATSEGTANLGMQGYNLLVGATASQPLMFGSYRDHPRVVIQVQPELISSAAGRYQILARYYDAYKVSLKLLDFSPDSQDAIAVQMLTEVGAIPDIEAGDFASAIAKASSRWASLPGSTAGQHTNSLAELQQAYIAAGGQLA